jgi:hypothetical protein
MKGHRTKLVWFNVITCFLYEVLRYYGIDNSSPSGIIECKATSYSKERENGETQTIGIGLRRKRRNDDDDDNKDSTLIDPANRREMDDVVNSGNTLKDKA